MPSPDTKPLRWSDYRGALRRRWWLIAVITLAAALITLAISLAQKPIYEAEARIQVSPDSGSSVFGQVNTDQQTDPERVLRTQAQVIESERVRDQVKTDLGDQLRPDQEPPAAKAEVLGDTNIISVKVLSVDPGTAEILANQYVAAYIQLGEQTAIDQMVSASKEISAKIEDVQGQIDGLLPDDPQVPALVAQIGGFRQQLNQLQIATSLKTSGVAVVQKATVPVDPVAPRPLRNTLIAALVAFLASLLLVLLLERFNRAVRNASDLGRISDLQVLAEVPYSEPTDNRPISLSAPSIGAAEAYRGLRSTFHYLATHDDARMIVVASAMSDEGKTTTAANLAVVLAQAGRKVVLVDADLRQPHQHDMFGTTVEPGLVDLLTWQHDKLALRRLDLGDGAELMLIPAGSVPLGSSELLGSARGVQLFNELRETYDHVIIDSAPILPVADTMALVTIADATVVVVRSTQTARSTVQSVLRRLGRVDGKVVGFILNQVPSRFMPGGSDRYGRYGIADLGAAPPVLVPGAGAESATAADSQRGLTGGSDSTATAHSHAGSDAYDSVDFRPPATVGGETDYFARTAEFASTDDVELSSTGYGEQFAETYTATEFDDDDDDEFGEEYDVQYDTGYDTEFDPGDSYDAIDVTQPIPIPVDPQAVEPLEVDRDAVEQLVQEVMEDVYSNDDAKRFGRASKSAPTDEAEDLWSPNDPNDFPNS